MHINGSLRRLWGPSAKLFTEPPRVLRRAGTPLVRYGPLLAAGPLTVAACGMQGGGVREEFLAHPPYYAGTPVSYMRGTGLSVGHLPIAYQRRAGHAPIFDPSLSEAAQALLADMTAFLDSLEISHRVAEGGRVSAVAHADTRQPPDVQFGCAGSKVGPARGCAFGDETVPGRNSRRMRLAVKPASSEWTRWIGQVMADNGTERVLVITLEVGHYRVRQRGVHGRQEVELGTSHIVAIPRPTSRDRPVAVLQLTGALVGADGNVIRIGAEGLMVCHTRPSMSAFLAEEPVSDDDVASLRSILRDDLAGRPLVWQTGLRTLVQGLLGQGVAG